MALYKQIDLQLFADGGASGGAVGSGGTGEGSAAAAAVSEGSASEGYPEGMPERAKKHYERAVKKAQTVDTAKETDVSNEAEASEAESKAPARPTYKELIESDEYREEHEKHVRRLIRDRLKGRDAQAEADMEILRYVGQKYGLDASSDSFKADLLEAVKSDDGIYEKYAEEHDVPIAEAKRMVGLEQQLEKVGREAEERKIAAENERIINELRERGNATKAEYPEFDLDTQMKDMRFRRLVAALGGDTTQAYEALNHKALQRSAVAAAESRAQAAVIGSVKANRLRPSDGGISGSPSASAAPDFRSMNISELRAWAARQRHK